jgi:hypothetical protein
MTLSPQVLELITKARIVSFATWADCYSPATLALLQAADDERRFLSDGELQAIPLAPGGELAARLRDLAPELVDGARAVVLAQFPDILAPGGGLYPPQRAEACWRDFWQFLRCVSYGVMADRADYLSPVGLGYMEELYRELQVPLAAMVVGLTALQAASLTAGHGHGAISPPFEALIEALGQFQN